MDDWKEVWERKGETGFKDIRWMNGYEDTQADGKKISSVILTTLGISSEHNVLEVGCGAGYIAQFISPHCNYYGIDRSKSLVDKHRKILGSSVCISEANSIPFADNSFDHAFCNGVFHYFPDHEYAWNVISEMQRVSKGKIFISDLPMRSKRSSHLLFTKEMFDGCKISSGLYEPHVRNRFNVLIT